jgi:hypothetical protein
MKVYWETVVHLRMFLTAAIYSGERSVTLYYVFDPENKFLWSSDLLSISITFHVIYRKEFNAGLHKEVITFPVHLN